MILLRSDIRLMPSDIALRAVLEANIISLSRSENITMPLGIISLCSAEQNITKNCSGSNT